MRQIQTYWRFIFSSSQIWHITNCVFPGSS